jgi:hypothetical protein
MGLVTIGPALEPSHHDSHRVCAPSQGFEFEFHLCLPFTLALFFLCLSSLDSQDAAFFDMVLCVAVLTSVGILLLFHTYLILTAQTTIEFYQNRVAMMVAKKRGVVCDGSLSNPRNSESICKLLAFQSFFSPAYSWCHQPFHNPWDLGYRRNWVSVFGASRFWFVPSTKPPPGDGCSWPLNPKVTE